MLHHGRRRQHPVCRHPGRAKAKQSDGLWFAAPGEASVGLADAENKGMEKRNRDSLNDAVFSGPKSMTATYQARSYPDPSGAPDPALGVTLGAVAFATTAFEQRDCSDEKSSPLPRSHRPLSLRGLPLPTRRHRAVGALVPALRPVLPRCRRAAHRASVEVDHVTIYRWVQRFAPLLADAARPCRHTVGARWWVDETYVKVAGRWRYVYRAVDQFGQVVDVFVSRRRDTMAARRFFEHAIGTTKSLRSRSSPTTPVYLRRAQGAGTGGLAPDRPVRQQPCRGGPRPVEGSATSDVWVQAGPERQVSRLLGMPSSRTFGAATTSWR